MVASCRQKIIFYVLDVESLPRLLIGTYLCQLNTRYVPICGMVTAHLGIWEEKFELLGPKLKIELEVEKIERGV